MTDSSFNLPRFNLGDRYAVISGAAGLLGIEHARAILAANGNVILWDIESNSLDRATTQLKSEFDPIRIRSSIVDVTNETAINKAVEILIKDNIEISILINNAAINPKYSSAQLDHSRLENFTLENWNKEISVGLTSAFLCSKIVGSRMANHNNNGVILNIASDLSLIAPDQRLYRLPNRADDNQPVKPVTYSVISLESLA